MNVKLETPGLFEKFYLGIPKNYDGKTKLYCKEVLSLDGIRPKPVVVPAHNEVFPESIYVFHLCKWI